MRTLIVFGLALLELSLCLNVYSHENVSRKQIIEVIERFQFQIKSGSEKRDPYFREKAENDLRLSLNSLIAQGGGIEDVIVVLLKESLSEEIRTDFIHLLKRLITERVNEDQMLVELSLFFKTWPEAHKKLEIQQIVAGVVMGLVYQQYHYGNLNFDSWVETMIGQTKWVEPQEAAHTEIALTATIMPPGFEVAGSLGAVMTLVPMEQISTEKEKITLVLNGRFDLKAN
ncbi:MAG: hypothetical protein NDI69_12315 [Bacteriovoracaceae bacterium]|nr:hypothetical protein [Bacteriovoracaceae bacterium]